MRGAKADVESGANVLYWSSKPTELALALSGADKANDTVKENCLLRTLISPSENAEAGCMNTTAET